MGRMMSSIVKSSLLSVSVKERVQTRRVVRIDGASLVKVAVEEIVRVQADIPAGQGAITARTEGPVALIATSDIRQVVHGNPSVGVETKEFDVRAQRRGKAKIVVTIDNKTRKTQETKEYLLEIE